MRPSDRRATQALDPHPSPAQLREIFRQKTGRDVDDLARGFIEMREKEHTRATARIFAREATQSYGPPWAPVTVGDVLKAQRIGDMLELVLAFAPRTKKGSTTLGIRQSPQYRVYRDNIVTVVKRVKARLGLPLPPRPQTYNLAAVYYVDRYGKTADLFGLHDGLADALQNAAVIENDWQFRTADGSRIVVDDPTPRVEISITPIEP